MFFLQAFTTPVTVVIGDVLVEIPRFTVRDFADWGEELKQKFVEQATSHLDDEKKTEYLAFYPILPPTRSELRRSASTDEGMDRIIRTCLKKAKFFSVKMVKKTKTVVKGTDPLTGKPIEVKEPYEVPTKGDSIPAKGEKWIEEVLLSNTGRMGHLAIELADLNDTSMAVPPRVAKLEQKEQEEEEGQQDPLSETETGGGID